MFERLQRRLRFPSDNCHIRTTNHCCKSRHDILREVFVDDTVSPRTAQRNGAHEVPRDD